MRNVVSQITPLEASVMNRSMTDSRNLLSSSNRRGVTLIELLIVVGLLTILATVSLTSVKGLLKDQKVTQASRVVQQYFENAKVKAITTGRPVAVFLDRVSLQGDGTGNPLPSNFTTNRLSLGDVKPPYTGDIVDATGVLWDIDFTVAQNTNTPTCIARIPDNFADQIRFSPIDVVSGFGIPNGQSGFVSPGDLIEFEGSSRQYEIEWIEFVPITNGGTATGNFEVAVTFFNPPAPTVMNGLMAANNLQPSKTTPGFICPYWSTENPSLPVSQDSRLTGLDAPTELTSQPSRPKRSKFRIYRRPVKSLVGAVTMPRGTCVDLFMSGLGLANAAFDPAGSVFNKPLPPMNFRGVPLSPSSYSRVGILFDRTGRPASLFLDEKYVPLASPGPAAEEVFQEFPIDNKLYLMVGRTDQVATNANALLSKPAPEDREALLANIFDPANSWICINPQTGLVTTTPVTAIADATVAAANAAGAPGLVVRESRALAAVGANSGGK
ncbi:MAG: Tfp pilus assembly protein FimT/FimU [Aureliella sp.]